MSKRIGWIVGLIAIVLAIVFTVTKSIEARAEKMAQQIPAMENAGVWLNSAPLTAKDLEGKVVLIDIWEFTCVNCLRTMPYLKEWHKKYAADGLLIVGVHCPEFSFGKDSTNVGRFVRAQNIPWPIVLDNDFKIWRALLNRYWPRKFLYDHTGKFVYDHVGEGGYVETERKIQELLAKKNGKSYEMGTLGYVRDEDKPDAYCYPRSPETYAGFERGSIGNKENAPGKIKVYQAEDGRPVADIPYLKGEWLQSEEYLQYTGDGNSDERLTYKFTGNEMNAVLRGPEGSEQTPLLVQVTMDDRPVAEMWRGPDLTLKADGNTYLELREPRMYRVIYSLRQHGEHIIKFYPKASGFELYAFTFGSCTIP